MSKDIWTHLYGLPGILLAIIGFILSRGNNEWADYILLASGWVAALGYGIILWKLIKRSTTESEKIGRLLNQINNLENQLENRSDTADYLASLLLGKKATPRKNT